MTPEDETFTISILFFKDEDPIGEGFETIYKTTQGKNLTLVKDTVYKPQKEE